MKYKYEINIQPCVNFATKAAEDIAHHKHRTQKESNPSHQSLPRMRGERDAFLQLLIPRAAWLLLPGLYRDRTQSPRSRPRTKAALPGSVENGVCMRNLSMTTTLYRTVAGKREVARVLEEINASVNPDAIQPALFKYVKEIKQWPDVLYDAENKFFYGLTDWTDNTAEYDHTTGFVI